MLKRFFNILLNPFIQALVIAGLVIAFLPQGIKKYHAELVMGATNFDNSQFIYADMDHDGNSERINTFHNLSGNVGITLMDGMFTLGQWNFRGIFEPKCPRVMTGNYNNDENDEIYIFTLVGDSLMLHALAFSSKPVLFIHDRLITRLGKSLKDPDYSLLPGALTDMNGDGSGDLVFSVNAGHSRQPRNVFIYDILNDTLYLSPKSGSFIGNMILEDLDGDSFMEIILSTYASSNYNNDPIEFTDTSSWLMVLDHDLDFLFTPVEFPGPTGGIQVSATEDPSGVIRLLCIATFGSPRVDTKKWFFTDLKGNILKERELNQENPLYMVGLLPARKKHISDKDLGIIENDGFYEIDANLNISKISDIKFSRWIPEFLDVDLDGNDEIIVLKPDHEQHLIYRDDFTHPTALDFPIQSSNPVLSVKMINGEPPQLSVQGDQDWKLFNYGINLLYRLRFLIYLGIYLVILGFILLIRKLYSFQLKKKYETEQKITRLQLAGIKAQMEPHFIMNTINTIGSSIYRQKPEDAYKLLLNFSGMVRSLLISSDKLTRTIGEETEFVRNYLELERSRFQEMFSFSIIQDDEVSPESIVPKMIIQIHAENAMKHGLMPKKSGGHLDISITKDQDYLLISIKDNGIGRNAASKKMSESTGRGMKILAQLFETYNKHNSKPLRQEIIDLFAEEKKPAGTMVKIWVPMEFNEGIF